jgi:hypothetical protein
VLVPPLNCRGGQLAWKLALDSRPERTRHAIAPKACGRIKANTHLEFDLSFLIFHAVRISLFLHQKKVFAMSIALKCDILHVFTFD